MAFGSEFEQARDFLILHRADYAYAYEHFRWPERAHFNWALDYFDSMSEGNNNTALWVVHEDGHEEKYSFADLSGRSSQVANYLTRLGLKRGDHVLLMLGEEVALWELMLACMKIGAVMMPVSNLLSVDELQDRLLRGEVKMIATTVANSKRFVVESATALKLVVDGEVDGWSGYAEATRESANFKPEGETKSSDPLLMYFTSGIAAKPKIIEHTHQSYPVGNLSTMYWVGVRPGDIHLSICQPGESKHTWSNFFVPWNAEATVLVHRHERFDAKKTLEAIEKYNVTSFVAPPTVWRMLMGEDLSNYKVSLREAVSSGESLDADIIPRVQELWGVTVREGYGQTEATALIGNCPGQSVKPGVIGKPLPGYSVALLDRDNNIQTEGEICIDLSQKPVGLMNGSYEKYYHTGDMASRDEEGYFTFIGRGDDVFKSAGYRISPVEIEAILLEHPAVREVAVIPSPHSVRLNVPKAIIFLAKGMEPTKELALQILNHSRMRLAPYKRVRRVEFSDLPKTTSGKIRRTELKVREQKRVANNEKSPYEFWEEDFKAVLPENWAQDLP